MGDVCIDAVDGQAEEHKQDPGVLLGWSRWCRMRYDPQPTCLPIKQMSVGLAGGLWTTPDALNPNSFQFHAIFQVSVIIVVLHHSHA